MAEKVALVTGASRGIGAAIAERLRRDGWQVETAERASGVDMADPEAAAGAVERLERIDALVANAGTIVRKTALEHTIEDWAARPRRQPRLRRGDRTSCGAAHARAGHRRRDRAHGVAALRSSVG